MSSNAKPTPEHRPVDRRKFLTAAAAGAALSLTAKSYANVVGSNSRLGVAFLGCGGRAQAHINLVLKFAKDGRGVVPAGVCDVWDGLDEEYYHDFGGTVTRRRYAQGLYPSAVKCGLDPADRGRVVKDYRLLLDLKDIDLVCIATPDHWHARMTLDALAAGKDVYVEKPMTRTPAEAVAVADAALRHNRIVTVGVQSLADPSWRVAGELIRGGKIGHVAQIAAGVFRNDIRGQWRFYRLSQEMTAKTVDWNLFLGHQFEVNGERLGPTPQEMPFDRATFAQWRCYRPFSGGPFSDLLTHTAAKLLAATGLRFPSRVVGAGGLFFEHDGRDVPDVATLAADFAEGCQMLLTAATISGYPTEEVIRGRRGTLKFVKGGLELFHDDPARAGNFPPRLERPLSATESMVMPSPRNETESLWENFLDCVRRRDRNTLCPPDLGAAAVAVTAMGWESCRRGVALAWDRERRAVRPAAEEMPRYIRATDLQPPNWSAALG
jgi:predicted dehydrogenase